MGRSNVGKSSLINSLTGQRKLAFTSSTPGRTRTVNFYRVDNSFFLVDLPGYGYAKASRELSREWKGVADRYLRNRDNLRLCCLAVDSRHGCMESDLQLKAWLESFGRPYVVVATKFDKLNQSQQQRGIRAFHSEGVEPLMYSAVTGRGVRELWQAITKALQTP